MKDKINYWLNLLPQMTRDEAQLIEDIINLDKETQMAFKLAKRIFEEKDE